MTNNIAIWLALLILAVFAGDWFLFGGHLPLFLARKISDLIVLVAFWR